MTPATLLTRCLLAAPLTFVVPATPGQSRPSLPTRHMTCPPDSVAPVQPSDILEMEAGFSYEDLDKNFEDWRSLYLEFSAKMELRTSVYGSLRFTDRFGLSDQEIFAGGTYPLGDALTGLVEITTSPSHRVLANWSLLGQLQHEFGEGWLAHAGWRHAQFTSASVNLGLLTLERYWNEFRASYTAYLAFVPGAGTSAAHRFWVSWYYDSPSTVHLSFSLGKEVENLGLVAGILSTNVRSFSLFGRHWFTPSWAVTYDATIHTQGDLYTRQGVRLGIRHLF